MSDHAHHAVDVGAHAADFSLLDGRASSSRAPWPGAWPRRRLHRPLLTALIALITNLSFYRRWSLSFARPAGNHLGSLVIVVPVVGGLLVGLMARYGSKAIRGHGIPEAMEQVLFNESRIPARMTFLKPLSAAIAIGTGGPFGAEGPIIATGGALGSLVGQLVQTHGGRAQDAARRGRRGGHGGDVRQPGLAPCCSPSSSCSSSTARARSSRSRSRRVTAAGVRIALVGAAPVFAMPDLAQPGGGALVVYVGIGALVGVASVYVTRAVYCVEDAFEKLPDPLDVVARARRRRRGRRRLRSPHTLGVGYDNIERIVSADARGPARSSSSAR